MTIEDEVKGWKAQGFNVVSCGPDVPIDTRQELEREGFKVLDHNHKPWRNEPALSEPRPEHYKGPRNRWGNLR